MTQSTLLHQGLARFMPSEKYRFPAVVGLVFGTLALVYVALLEGAPTNAEVTVLPVAVSKVERQSHYYSTFHFTGLAQARQVSRLGFDRVGLVDEVLLDVGDEVKAGDIMARLDADRIEVAFGEAKIQLQSADERLKLAAARAKRVALTHKSGNSSDQQLDLARSDLASARSQAAATRSQYLGLKVDLEKSEIRAPFDGVVTHRYLHAGASASPGVAVFRFVEKDAMEIRVGVTTEVADKLNVGDELTFERGGQADLKARLTRKGPNVNLESRTVTLVFDLDDPRSVRDGELMDLSLNLTREGDGFWVPLRAMSADVRGLWRVYGVQSSDDGSYQHIIFENVQVIAVEGDRAFVTGSMKDGELIVTDGLDRLAPGQRVRVLRSSD